MILEYTHIFYCHEILLLALELILALRLIVINLTYYLIIFAILINQFIFFVLSFYSLH